MGMGEPMHNYDNVWTALRRLTSPDGFGLGARNITLSTVGLVPMIDRMADEGLQIGLAVSLHAATDDVRGQLVPINRRYPIADVLAAVERYTEKTHRRVTFEYALMRGINDSQEMAELLARSVVGPALPRESDPAESGGGQSVSAQHPRGHAALCRDFARAWHFHDGAPAAGELRSTPGAASCGKRSRRRRAAECALLWNDWKQKSPAQLGRRTANSNWLDARLSARSRMQDVQRRLETDLPSSMTLTF